MSEGNSHNGDQMPVHTMAIRRRLMKRRSKVINAMEIASQLTEW